MEKQQTKISSRVKSIDALRGFDMFFLIGGAEIFRSFATIWPNATTEQINIQLQHVAWHGFHFYDLIWPLFLFLVGVVLPFSISGRMNKADSKKKLHMHILTRALILIILGWMLRGLLRFDWPNMNWTSILGRIGICYALAALIVANTNWRVQVWIIGTILILYYAVMMLIPVPGHGAGDLTPAGNLAGYFDNLLLPEGMAFRFKDGSVSIFGTILATCTMLIGVQAGHWLRSDRSGAHKVKGLLIAGIVCLIAGYIWGFSFPINKKLWTSSFVLYSGGFSLLLMTLFYWLIDVKGFGKWGFFFVVIGANSLAIYFAQAVINFNGIAKFFIQGIISYAGMYDIIILAISMVIVKWLFLYFLYRHKIFIKV